MGKLVLYSIFLYTFVLTAYCQDELVILHCPSTMSFESAEKLNRSTLKHVISTAMGYSVGKTDNWSGLQVSKPFGWAKGVYVFHLPGVKLFNSETKNHYFVVPDDENIDDTWNAMIENTERRYPDERLEMKKIVLGDKPKVYTPQESPYDIDVSKEGPIVSINSSRPTSENDIVFIQELNKLHSLTDKLMSKSNKNGKPDLFWVTAPNIGQIIESRDDDSTNILLNALRTISDKIVKTYNKNNKKEVLIVALTENPDLKRTKRQTTTETKPTLISLNVAEDYDEDFPVIFNIVFWFSLAMLFAVIAICMVIGGMDPGRDSIIYRMTSTRMKKDN